MEISISPAATVKRADTDARHAARSMSPLRLIASTASSTLLTKKPVGPSSISSGIDPRLQAMTGVPQASATTTARRPPSCWTWRPSIPTPFPTDAIGYPQSEKRPLNENEPKPEPNIPTCPPELGRLLSANGIASWAKNLVRYESSFI